jgi:hypothetical protein
MTSSLDMYQELYTEQADRSAELAGELGAMAFVAGELLLKAQAGRLDTFTGRKVIEEMENTLRTYYRGNGKQSPFARPWAKLTFEDGIEAGMKEAV